MSNINILKIMIKMNNLNIMKNMKIMIIMKIMNIMNIMISVNIFFNITLWDIPSLCINLSLKLINFHLPYLVKFFKN